MQANRQDLSLRARRIGTVIWASFLAACLGTMFFFAFIAPEELVGEDFTTTMFDHLGVYTLGFFGLWLVAVVASALTLTMSQSPDGKRPEDRHSH